MINVVCRRVSFETAESPVTAVAHLSVDGNTVIIATQWMDSIRMWAVSSRGFLTPCGSVHGQVLFQMCSACFCFTQILPLKTFLNVVLKTLSQN